jgi:hypothetical protein
MSMHLSKVEIVEVPIPPNSVGTPFQITIPADSVIVHAERQGQNLFLHTAMGVASPTPRTLFIQSAGTANHHPNIECSFVALIIDRAGERSTGYLFHSHS